MRSGRRYVTLVRPCMDTEAGSEEGRVIPHPLHVSFFAPPWSRLWTPAGPDRRAWQSLRGGLTMFGQLGLSHGFGSMGVTGLLRLHLVSESLIALACFPISIALLRIVRSRRGFRFNGVLFCLAASILACGVTYGVEVLTQWRPVFWVSIAIEASAAAALDRRPGGAAADHAEHPRCPPQTCR